MIFIYFFLFLIFIVQCQFQIQCPYKCKSCSLQGNQLQRKLICNSCEQFFSLDIDQVYCVSTCPDHQFYFDDELNPTTASQQICTSTCTQENYAIDNVSRSCRKIIRCPRIVTQGVNFSSPITRRLFNIDEPLKFWELNTGKDIGQFSFSHIKETQEQDLVAYFFGEEFEERFQVEQLLVIIFSQSITILDIQQGTSIYIQQLRYKCQHYIKLKDQILIFSHDSNNHRLVVTTFNSIIKYFPIYMTNIKLYVYDLILNQVLLYGQDSSDQFLFELVDISANVSPPSTNKNLLFQSLINGQIFIIVINIQPGVYLLQERKSGQIYFLKNQQFIKSNLNLTSDLQIVKSSVKDAFQIKNNITSNYSIYFINCGKELEDSTRLVSLYSIYEGSTEINEFINFSVNMGMDSCRLIQSQDSQNELLVDILNLQQSIYVYTIDLAMKTYKQIYYKQNVILITYPGYFIFSYNQSLLIFEDFEMFSVSLPEQKIKYLIRNFDFNLENYSYQKLQNQNFQNQMMEIIKIIEDLDNQRVITMHIDGSLRIHCYNQGLMIGQIHPLYSFTDSGNVIFMESTGLALVSYKQQVYDYFFVLYEDNTYCLYNYYSFEMVQKAQFSDQVQTNIQEIMSIKDLFNNKIVIYSFKEIVLLTFTAKDKLEISNIFYDKKYLFSSIAALDDQHIFVIYRNVHQINLFDLNTFTFNQDFKYSDSNESQIEEYSIDYEFRYITITTEEGLVRSLSERLEQVFTYKFEKDKRICEEAYYSNESEVVCLIQDRTYQPKKYLPCIINTKMEIQINCIQESFTRINFFHYDRIRKQLIVAENDDNNGNINFYQNFNTKFYYDQQNYFTFSFELSIFYIEDGSNRGYIGTSDGQIQRFLLDNFREMVVKNGEENPQKLINKLEIDTNHSLIMEVRNYMVTTHYVKGMFYESISTENDVCGKNITIFNTYFLDQFRIIISCRDTVLVGQLNQKSRKYDTIEFTKYIDPENIGIYFFKIYDSSNSSFFVQLNDLRLYQYQFVFKYDTKLDFQINRVVEYQDVKAFVQGIEFISVFNQFAFYGVNNFKSYIYIYNMTSGLFFTQSLFGSQFLDMKFKSEDKNILFILDSQALYYINMEQVDRLQSVPIQQGEKIILGNNFVFVQAKTHVRSLSYKDILYNYYKQKITVLSSPYMTQGGDIVACELLDDEGLIAISTSDTTQIILYIFNQETRKLAGIIPKISDNYPFTSQQYDPFPLTSLQYDPFSKIIFAISLTGRIYGINISVGYFVQYKIDTIYYKSVDKKIEPNYIYLDKKRNVIVNWSRSFLSFYSLSRIYGFIKPISLNYHQIFYYNNQEKNLYMIENDGVVWQTNSNKNEFLLAFSQPVFRFEILFGTWQDNKKLIIARDSRDIQIANGEENKIIKNVYCQGDNYLYENKKTKTFEKLYLICSIINLSALQNSNISEITTIHTFQKRIRVISAVDEYLIVTDYYSELLTLNMRNDQIISIIEIDKNNSLIKIIPFKFENTFITISKSQIFTIYQISFNSIVQDNKYSVELNESYQLNFNFTLDFIVHDEQFDRVIFVDKSRRRLEVFNYNLNQLEISSLIQSPGTDFRLEINIKYILVYNNIQVIIYDRNNFQALTYQPFPISTTFIRNIFEVKDNPYFIVVVFVDSIKIYEIIYNPNQLTYHQYSIMERLSVEGNKQQIISHKYQQIRNSLQFISFNPQSIIYSEYSLIQSGIYRGQIMPNFFSNSIFTACYEIINSNNPYSQQSQLDQLYQTLRNFDVGMQKLVINCQVHNILYLSYFQNVFSEDFEIRIKQLQPNEVSIKDDSDNFFYNQYQNFNAPDKNSTNDDYSQKILVMNAEQLQSISTLVLKNLNLLFLDQNNSGIQGGSDYSYKIEYDNSISFNSDINHIVFENVTINDIEVSKANIYFSNLSSLVLKNVVIRNSMIKQSTLFNIFNANFVTIESLTVENCVFINSIIVQIQSDKIQTDVKIKNLNFNNNIFYFKDFQITQSQINFMIMIGCNNVQMTGITMHANVFKDNPSGGNQQFPPKPFQDPFFGDQQSMSDNDKEDRYSNNQQQDEFFQNNSNLISFFNVKSLIIETMDIQNNENIQLLLFTNKYKSQFQIMEVTNDFNTFRDFTIKNNKITEKVSKYYQFNYNLIVIRASYVDFQSSTIANNYSASQNGTIQVIDTYEMQFTQVKFLFNYALQGGAIFSKNSNITLSKDEFLKNKALASGGAILISEYSKLNIKSKTNFTENQSLIGGAIRVKGQSKLIYNEAFPPKYKGNKAEFFGDDVGNFNKLTSSCSILSPQYNNNIPQQNSNEDISQDNYQLYTDNSLNLTSYQINNLRSGASITFLIKFMDTKQKQFSIKQPLLKYPPIIQLELQNINIEIEQVLKDNQHNFKIIYQKTINVVQRNLVTFADYSLLHSGFVFEDITIKTPQELFDNQLNQKGNSQALPVPFNHTFYISFLAKSFDALENQIISPIIVKIQFRECIKGEIYQKDDTDIICQPCKENTYSLIDPNYQDSTQKCQECPKNALKCFKNQIYLKDGFWRLSNESDYLLECYNRRENCQANQNKQKSICEEGYVGPLCESCDVTGDVWGKKYVQNKKYTCEQCDFGNVALTYAVMMILLVIPLVYLFYSINAISHKFQNIHIGYYLRMMEIISISKSCQKNGNSHLMKIFFYFIQIFSAINSIPLQDNKLWMTFFQETFGQLPQSISMNTQCLLLKNAKNTGNQKFDLPLIYSRQIIGFFSPFIYYIGVVLIYKSLTFCKLMNKQKTFLYTAFVLLILFFQPNIISQIAQVISCRKIGDYYYIQADVQYQCYSHSHQLFVYTFAIPALLIWFILPCIFFHQIYINKKRLETFKIMNKYGYLYSEYKAQYYYWEFIKIVIRMQMIIITNTFRQQYPFIHHLNIFILFIYLSFQFKINPYKDKRLARFDYFTHIYIAIIIIINIQYEQFQILLFNQNNMANSNYSNSEVNNQPQMYFININSDNYSLITTFLYFLYLIISSVCVLHEIYQLNLRKYIYNFLGRIRSRSSFIRNCFPQDIAQEKSQMAMFKRWKFIKKNLDRIKFASAFKESLSKKYQNNHPSNNQSNENKLSLSLEFVRNKNKDSKIIHSKIIKRSVSFNKNDQKIQILDEQQIQLTTFNNQNNSAISQSCQKGVTASDFISPFAERGNISMINNDSQQDSTTTDLNKVKEMNRNFRVHNINSLKNLKSKQNIEDTFIISNQNSSNSFSSKTLNFK